QEHHQGRCDQSMIGLCYEEKSDLRQSLTAYQTVKKYSAPQLLKETASTRAKKIKRLHKDSLHIEADKIHYEAEKEKAVYSENVKIYWSDCTITCEKATANLKKAFIISEGNVTCMSRKDLKLKCLYLHLFPKAKIASLYGNAEIAAVDPSSKEERIIAKGKKINYDFAQNTYTLEK
ncbi:LptA/OstA family protein, partial [candidate division CSSED10-310 bacterium]